LLVASLPLADLDQFVCDGMTLSGVIEPTAGGDQPGLLGELDFEGLLIQADPGRRAPPDYQPPASARLQALKELLSLLV
jgi:hypothetical protein